MILRHVVSGKTSKQIAGLLGISHRTVEVHRLQIRQKTNTSSLAELIELVLDDARSLRAQVTLEEALNDKIQREIEQLKQLISNLPFAVAMFDRKMRYLAVSERWLKNYSIAGKDIIGQSHYAIFPEIPSRWRQFHLRGLRGETLGEAEDRFERMDGTVHWERWEIHPWHSPDGQVGGIIIYSEDVTAYVQARNELQELRKKLEMALASTNAT